MTFIKVRVVRTHKKLAEVDKFRRLLENYIVEECAPIIEDALRDQVTYWASIPDFNIRVETRGNVFGVVIEPIGPMARFWNYVSGGVKGHYIRPVKATSLRWHESRVKGFGLLGPSGVQAVSPGNYKDGFIYSKGHYWPGIEPRHFEKAAVKEARHEYKRELRNVFRRAWRKAQRERARATE